MNIFFIDRDPIKAAQAHCDKHVVKMILESAQLLSTAHRVIDIQIIHRDSDYYRATHCNHPCAIWVRGNIQQYSWTYQLLEALFAEYTYRYEKVHATEKLRRTLSKPPVNLLNGEWSDPPLAMPEYFKNTWNGDAVTAYRQYYAIAKKDLLTYKRRERPGWLQ